MTQIVPSYRHRPARWLGVAGLLGLLTLPVHAEPQLLWLDGPPAEFLEAGHGDFSVQTVPRYGLMVTDVGTPDPEGKIFSFSFEVRMSSFNSTVVAINGLRAWRISVVSGALLGSTFQVRSNDKTQLAVTSAFGPLEGLAAGDLLLVERIPVPQPVQPTRFEDILSTPLQQVTL